MKISRAPLLKSYWKEKEYDNYNYKIIFEEQIKKLKRNGKEKEYNNKRVLWFEGEYENNKRNGKVEEYFYNGNVKFEGEYLNGKRWNEKGYNINKKKCLK